MTMRTIIKFTKVKRERLYATVYGDGRGAGYVYRNWPFRKERNGSETYYADGEYCRPLYRVNVIPKPLKGGSL